MTADSDYYTNKLHKFRRAPKKIRGPGFCLRTPGKIFLGCPDYVFIVGHC